MGVLVAFILLVVLVYKKVPAALAAIISAVVMCLLSGLDTMAVMKGDFMTAAGGFVTSYFLLFLLCGIYAAVMDYSGAAFSLGKWLANLLGTKGAIWGVSIAAAVMTYGGISAFVIVFAMYPIALVLFKEADIDRRMIPAAIGAGAFTLPNVFWGSPGVCNVIPTTFLGTDVRAAPAVSIVVGLFIFILSNLYLVWRNKRNQKKGIGFVPTEKINRMLEENEQRGTVNHWLALVPLVVIIVVLNVIQLDVLIAMPCGIVVAYIIFWNRIADKVQPLIAGTQSGIGSTLGTAPVVGLGGVAKLTSVFQYMLDLAMNMKGNPLISWALSATIITGVCASGSGGAALTGELLAAKYLAMGLNPEILHRILSCAVIVLDSLPWNGVMCTTMAACDLTHKESYGDLFMITVVINFLGLVLCTALGVIFY